MVSLYASKTMCVLVPYHVQIFEIKNYVNNIVHYR